MRDNFMTVLLNEEADGKILILTLSVKLGADDYAHFTKEVERAVAVHGKIRLLVEMYDFHGWTLGALWEDIKFDFGHFADIERVALVGDRKWEEGMAMFCIPFTTAIVRYFDESEANEASAWIHEGLVLAS